MNTKKKFPRKSASPFKVERVSATGVITNEEMLGAALQQLQQGGVDAAIRYLAGLDASKGATHIPLADRLTMLGHVVQQRDPKTALALAEKAIELSSDCIAAWGLAGAMQDRLGQYGRSALSLIRVVQSERAKPDQVLRAANLLVRFGQQEVALEAAKTAFDTLGKPLRWVSALLYIAQRTADWALVDALTAQLRDAYAKGDGDEVKESLRTHLLWCGDEATNIGVIQQWSARTIALPANVVLPTPLPLDGRQLRVGYLSSDFREHPTARLINGLLRHHDRSRFELFMYCSGWDDASPLRKEIESHFDHVHAVAQLSDIDAANLIRTHAIDVLVELNGPTRANRLGILAHRPAPVQIDYLGWPGSIGGRVVDYVVGDRYTIPAGVEKLYPEKIIFIEQTYQVNDYAARTLPVPLTRKQVGLPEGDWQVLGMFNAINKVHGAVWDAWMQILKAVPNALLWLLDPGPTALKHMARATTVHGVDPRRIVLAPRLPQDAHLSRLQCCDLMLDPWPYGGHTSTSDALFAGVPVVTLEGTNFASRVSGGLLRAAGLEMLIQPNVSAYIGTAIDLLGNPQKLSSIKRFITQQVPHSDVFDARSKARQLEAAYEQAIKWRIENLPPQTLTKCSGRATATHSVESLGQAAPLQPARQNLRIPLVVVCGPWGGGTSAVAGLLAQAGLQAPGPYVRVRDAKTPDTYEMKAFQILLKTLASEETLTRLQPSTQIIDALRRFRDEVLSPALDGGQGTLPMLKHGLTALLLPELEQVFDLRVVGVVRPLADIEATRLRRGWRVPFGQAGARIIYQHMFNYMINTATSFKVVRYVELMADPAAVLEELAAFCSLTLTPVHREKALAFVTR